MSLTILKQTIIMLILITVGIVCSKTKIISKESNKDLSKFVLQVVNPVMIFMSYQTDYKPELVKNLSAYVRSLSRSVCSYDFACCIC